MITQSLIQTVWWIPLYGLIGAVAALPWFPGVIHRTGPRPAGYINLLMTSFAFLHSLLIFQAIWNQPVQELSLTWLEVANLDLSFPIEISSVTLGATVLITGLNLLAQIYALGYMEMDWGWARFYGLMGFFEAGLCALVLCNSLFFTYFILEILTLGTYLLVGFWFNQPLVVTGARDAFLTKRVGDLLLMMGVVALWHLTGTFEFPALAQWATTANLDPTTATLLGLALMAGPLGKCAQFPLHLWLDEAMEGPIPSTILRNSLVVAVGAWVLVKLYPILALSPITLATIVAVGSITAVGGSLVAIAQVDIKRTLSYLVSVYMGLVFIAVGTGQLEAALLLVLTHAVSMALLVMSVGAVIWNSVTQDLSQYGGLWSRRPASALAFLVGLGGLIALPPLGSFWAFLVLADGLWEIQPWLIGLLLFVNGLVAFGLGRVFGLVFSGTPKPMTERSPEVSWQMVLPMMLLLGFALHLPLVLQYLTLLPTWGNIDIILALLLTLSSSFAYLGWRFRPIQLPWQPIQTLLANDFYTAQAYRLTIIAGIGFISRITAFVDHYLVDGFVNLVSQISVVGGEALKYSTSGRIQFYMLTVLLGVVVMGAMMMMSH
ncbi:MAG: NAD(P)H-quinone oxidoreductase subunit F [Gloeobacterales cyanobacterium]